MKRVVLLLLTLSLVTLSLVGCGKSSNIGKIAPMTFDDVAGKRLVNLTTDERDGVIYNYISDRLLVTGEALIDIPTKDTKDIDSIFNKVNYFLQGEPNGVLTEDYGNYLMTEFAKTPYEWKQLKVNPVGFDPASRLYFVDVTYTTTSKPKYVVPSSAIPNGSPDEVVLKEKRYMDYVLYLQNKMKYAGTGNDAVLTGMLQSYEKAWGTVASIREEQQGISLLARTRNLKTTDRGIGRITYTGLINNSTFKTASSTMVIRYILRYNYNLGEPTDLGVKSLYVKEYYVNNYEDALERLKKPSDMSMEVLKPFLDRLINSYHKAVEESNDVGLYQLYTDYSQIDKYHDDLLRYAYFSLDGYDYEVLNKDDAKKTLTVLVRRELKIRAKGTGMSLPAYEDLVVFTLNLQPNDTITIGGITPVKTTLIGEPLSEIRTIEGISDMIQYSSEAFTAVNETNVLEAVKEFSKTVHSGIAENSTLLTVLDPGVSQTSLRRIVETIDSIQSNKKITYVINWETRTNVFASIAVREIFETDGGNYDTEAVIDLVNKNGEWKVVNYVRTLNLKTSDTSLDINKALCVDEVGKEQVSPNQEEVVPTTTN